MGVLSQIGQKMAGNQIGWPAYGSLSLSSILKMYASKGQSIKIRAENVRVSSRVMILSFIT